MDDFEGRDFSWGDREYRLSKKEPAKTSRHCPLCGKLIHVGESNWIMWWGDGPGDFTRGHLPCVRDALGEAVPVVLDEFTSNGECRVTIVKTPTGTGGWIYTVGPYESRNEKKAIGVLESFLRQGISA